MPGFITARDGVYNVMHTLVGTGDGQYRVGFKHDRRFQTDAPGDGYPYYTVSPSFDKNAEAYRWTRTNQAAYAVMVRVFALFDGTPESETAFLTLLDLTDTTLRANANITLGGTVDSCLVSTIKLGYNEGDQPTMRIAEIECIVTQQIPRL